MSKQDRQGVRTASDLERKYDFALLSKETGVGDTGRISQVEQMVSQYIATTNGRLEEISTEVTKNAEAIETIKTQGMGELVASYDEEKEALTLSVTPI